MFYFLKASELINGRNRINIFFLDTREHILMYIIGFVFNMNKKVYKLISQILNI